MREIKFRAWDKFKKTMHKVDYIDWSEQEVGCGDGMFILMLNCVLMQYTGLKDKNGVEIYEGDVVKVKYTHASSIEGGFGVNWITVKGVVTYTHCGFDVQRLGEVGIVVWEGITHMECLSDVESKWEVLGNIYEYPELLKEEAE